MSETEISKDAAKVKALYDLAKKQESVLSLNDSLDDLYLEGKIVDTFWIKLRLSSALADMWFDGYNRGMDWRMEE